MQDSRTDIPWTGFVCVALGVFMATLDSSIVTVALPVIRADLNASLAEVQWVISVYLLVVTGLLLAAGRLADLLGQRRVYLAGLGLFALGSGLCALASTASQLVAARAAQGLGAALIMACAPAIVTALFPTTARGKGLGLVGTVVGLGLMSGPPVGGLLLEFMDWRGLFLLNLPVGAVALFFSARRLPELRLGGERRQSFDLPGTAFFTVAVLAVLLSMDRLEGGEGLAAALWASVSLLSTAAFLRRERSAADPLVDLALLKNPAFSMALLAAVLVFACGFIPVVLTPFYLTVVRGMSPLEVGLALSIPPAVMMLLASWAGSLSDRVGALGLTTAGLVIRTAGFVLLALSGALTPFPVVIAGLTLFGVGSAFFMSPNTSAIMGAVPPGALGVAGGLTAVARNLGMALGVGIGGAVCAHFADAAGPGGVDDPASFLVGWRAALWVSVGVSLLSLWVSRKRGSDRRSP